MAPINLAMRSLGGQTTKFLVGQPQEEIVIHTRLLSQYSEVFERMSNLPKIKHPTKRMINFLAAHVDKSIKFDYSGQAVILPFPAFPVKIMAAVGDYIYRGTLPEVSEFQDLHRMYEMASKFGMANLLNDIVDRFHEMHRGSGQGFKISELSVIYISRGLGKGMLWRFAIIELTGRMTRGELDEGSTAAFRVLCANYPAIKSEIIEMQLTYGRAILLTEFAKRALVRDGPLSKCTFHIHKLGTSCDTVEAEEADDLGEPVDIEEVLPKAKKPKSKKKKRPKKDQVGEVHKKVIGGRVSKASKRLRPRKVAKTMSKKSNSGDAVKQEPNTP